MRPLACQRRQTFPAGCEIARNLITARGHQVTLKTSKMMSWPARLPWAMALSLCLAACGNPYDAGAGKTSVDEETERFSFFYTSLDAMRRLSGSENGFGGDLRFGQATGLEGADAICQTIATDAGFGSKTWRAFLSATSGPEGRPVDAVNRIGDGPWYDRKGRLIASDVSGLIAERPVGDAATVNDLPDETGEPTSTLGTTADVLTGSNKLGLLHPDAAGMPKNTCNDWTDATLQDVFVMSGHAWLSGGVENWIAAHAQRSCLPGVNLASTGVTDGSSIGAGGGWGGLYCFALSS
jgi:hypothetical protein